ncbi:carboxypeptidase-like regulatory domain-containing protein [Flavobacterium arcticum]|uniref:Carboxypeptidase-like regulatory domain-containing protein n=1 Tax=Flavobacterium arcticum TaxID=1784713 RepID=A0A345H9B2_9FLAO|nr:carboxypeptidase-like regulatory domain-containing protein [Flavobacterium arcticum]AXG73172.1 carboxypeptidase-like regulatory domain-containing protein [Flavobacterium arcticum]KAF2512964.1 carboxypeptidase-like regulatory domain-containing protein [Flavobacterium arcticum]
MKFILFLLCSLLYVSIGYSQTLSGYVYDEKENLPLQGAFVYLDGTTLSASTDSLGYFKIIAKQKFSTDLVVSYIGFSNFKVSNPYQYINPIKILLREEVTKLDAVVISREASPFSREEMLKVFRENFLGTSKAARSCRITNEDAVVFHFDKNSNILYAKSIEPLQIRNNYLEYNVQFDLTDFGIRYKAMTLERCYQRAVYFSGTTSYKDISKGNAAYKQRIEAYLGSIPHLMRTLVSNSWVNQKFKLYVNGMEADPQKYFKITDTLGVKKVTVIQGSNKAKPLNINTSGETVEDLKKKQEAYLKKQGVINFTVRYNGNEESYFTCPTGIFYVDTNGQYFPISNLRFEGYMSQFKVADMLPADYR